MLNAVIEYIIHEHGVDYGPIHYLKKRKELFGESWVSVLFSRHPLVRRLYENELISDSAYAVQEWADGFTRVKPLSPRLYVYWFLHVLVPREDSGAYGRKPDSGVAPIAAYREDSSVPADDYESEVKQRLHRGRGLLRFALVTDQFMSVLSQKEFYVQTETRVSYVRLHAATSTGFDYIDHRTFAGMRFVENDGKNKSKRKGKSDGKGNQARPSDAGKVDRPTKTRRK